MSRVTLEIDPAALDRILGFDAVRKRFGRAQASETTDGIPTIRAAELGIEAVDGGGDMPTLDLNNLEIVAVDES